MKKLQRQASSLLLSVSVATSAIVFPALVLPPHYVSAASETETELLFQDDFQDGDLTGWQQQGGTWSVASEAGSDSNTSLKQSHTSNEAFITAGNVSWQNYSVETRIQLLDTAVFAGLLARFTDTNNYYTFRVANSTLEFAKNVKGTSTVLKTIPFTRTSNTWYTLRLEMVDDLIKGYLNGALVFEVYDNSLSSGKIALRTRWGQNLYDDITVKALRSTPKSDDFQSGSLSGWKQEAGAWVVAEDTTAAGNKLARLADPSTGGFLSGGVASWLDDAVEARFRPESGQAVYGIAARVRDQHNHYRLSADTGTQRVELVRVVNGQAVTLRSAAAALAVGEWHKLKLELVGTTLKGYLNNQLVVEAEDSTFGYGMAGIALARGAAAVDDASVVRLTDPSRPVTNVSLNSTFEGRTYEGIGYVSSSGSTKLLMDYPKEQQEEIIDYLFKPQFGASLNHYKMEIGSDVNSSSGTEPSHMRSATDFDITRGAGMWLADIINRKYPEVYLDALRWGTPNWVKNGTLEDKYLYYKNLLQGARDTYGIRFDYLGADINEGAFDRNWLVNVLRPRLNQDGFADVKIVARDAVDNPWGIATQIKTDAPLRDAIDALGGHYTFTSTPDAQNSGKPLWHSEARPAMHSAGLRGSSGILEDVAKGIMGAYVNGKMTKVELQPFLEAWSSFVPYNTKGALIASEPWSGHYKVTKGVWVVAHFTQFAKPGWKYLDGSSSVGSVFNYVTLKKPDSSGDYSTIVTNTTAQPQTYTFTLTGGLAEGPVHVWKTNEEVDFVQQSDLTPIDGKYSITVEPYSIYSLTTTTGQQKGQPKQPIPASGHLQLPYSEAYETYAAGKMPKYTHDQGGAFEVVNSGKTGKGLAQVITANLKPADWTYRTTPEPYTMLGDETWTDYNVSTDVKVEGTATAYAGIAGRIFNSPISGEPADGYHLRLFGDGKWQLKKSNQVLRSGALAGFNANEWHQLKLSFIRSHVKAFVDGVEVTSFEDQSNAFASGLIALGSSYHYTLFDNLVVERAGAAYPAYSERWDNTSPNIQYTGLWSHNNTGSYTYHQRTTSQSQLMSQVNDTTKGTGLNQYEYSGTWSSGSQNGAFNNDNSWSSVTNAFYQVRFKGTQARLYLPKANNHGIAAVSIDGGAETLVDLYAATRQEQSLVYTSAVLSPGEHIIKVRVTGTKNASSSGASIIADRIDIESGEQQQPELSFTFQGSGAALIGTGTVTGAVYLDGKLLEHTNRVVDTGTRRVLYSVYGLPTGQHHLSLKLQSSLLLDAVEILENVDTEAPVTTDDAPKGWVNRDTIVNLNAVDAGSGVKDTFYTINGGPALSGRAVSLTTEGTHQLTYWSVDQAGNVEERKNVVIQIDKTAPELQIVVDKPVLWPANHKPVSVTASVYSSDLLSQVSSVVLTSITPSELVTQSEPMVLDAQYGTMDGVFSLLAAKAGGKQGLLYTITYTAYDQAGNRAVRTTTVRVPHDQSDK
jgi:galactosylceramidase